MLWVLAGMTVVAVTVASSTLASNEAVKLMRDRVRAEAAFLSSNARIKVLLATGISGNLSVDSGRGRLFVDARTTAVASDEWVTLQDARGLVNLNQVEPPRLSALLTYCGAEPARTAELVDALLDYIDPDNLKRLNGAEAFEYRQAGSRPPRNARLLSSDELWRVAGWAALRGVWQRSGCDDLITVHSDGSGFNANTAPVALLRAGGLSAEAANALADARRDGVPAASGGLFTQTMGEVGFMGGGGRVGRTIRVSHQMASVEWSMVYELEATPLRPGGPWRMYDLRYPSKPPGTPVPEAELPSPTPELTERVNRFQNAASATPAPTQR